MLTATQLEQMPLEVEDRKPKRRRGTSNSNERGNTTNRRRRREWLVETYASDVSVIEVTWAGGAVQRFYPTDEAMQATWLAGLSFDDDAVTVDELPTCRCYRCGCLLTVDTVTVDRIKPGAEGGKYGTPLQDAREGRTNIRPACGPHNSSTGGVLGAARKKARSC